MPSMVNPRLLRPHPKNQEYYADLPANKYAEVKHSIEANGIRDPLKVTPDYTVLAGHQRLLIALELGLDLVPVEIRDVSLEEAEYLLIADNEERRQGDEDPIRKAKRAKFLKEYWGVRVGNPQLGQNALIGSGKKLKDVADVIREGIDTTKRLLKLNDLIPELQTLVSSGKLGTTAAEQLAYLATETQQELYGAMGESIGELTIKETKDLRASAADVERIQARLDTANARAAEAEQALAAMRDRSAATTAASEEIIDLKAKLLRLGQAKMDHTRLIRDLRAELMQGKKRLADATKETDRELKRKLAEAQEEARVLRQELQITKSPASVSAANAKLEEKQGMIRHLDREITMRRSALTFIRELRDLGSVIHGMEQDISQGYIDFAEYMGRDEMDYHIATVKRFADTLDGAWYQARDRKKENNGSNIPIDITGYRISKDN